MSDTPHNEAEQARKDFIKREMDKANEAIHHAEITLIRLPDDIPGVWDVISDLIACRAKLARLRESK